MLLWLNICLWKVVIQSMLNSHLGILTEMLLMKTIETKSSHILQSETESVLSVTASAGVLCFFARCFSYPWAFGNFPGGSVSKVSAYNVGDLGSIPGWKRSSGEGNGNPLQYSCLENPMDREAW